MYDINRLRKQRLAKQRKLLQDKFDEQWKPVDVINLDVIDKKTSDHTYTLEENYRAFKLFSIMDVDHDGSISLREVNRMLMGVTTTTFIIIFDHPDTGIIWGLDDEDCLIIDNIEPHSPASFIPALIHGLRIVRVNDRYYPPNDRKNLDELLHFILQLHDDPIEIEVVEPILILTGYSHMLDIQVEDHIFSAELPIGAVYNLERFKIVIANGLVQCHQAFKWMTVGVIKKRRQLFFQCDRFQFRLMFGTGPNYHRSCRFALGFAAEDYPLGHYHAGQTMAIDLDLGLSQDQLELLTTELFQRYDKDESGLLDFEEFRDFYVRFLDTDESLELLRKYALYRFRDQELEEWWYKRKEEKRDRKLRKLLSRQRNEGIRTEQTKKISENSEVCYDGIKRRRINGIIIQSPIRNKKIPEKFFESTDTVIAYDDSASIASDITTDVIKNELSTEELKIKSKRDKTKILYRKQQDIKKKQIQKMTAMREREKELRFEQAEDEELRESMAEVEMALSLGLNDVIQLDDTAVAGIKQFKIDFSNVIATPALQVNTALFNKTSKLKDIELDNDVPPSKIHPAILRYFMIKDKVIAPPFDSTKRHPAFFNSYYTRKSKRHTSLALDICKLITDERKEGVEYRKNHNIQRDFNEPPDDVIERKKKVRFLIPDRIINRNLLGRVTIVGISVYDLKSVHLTEANSPYVTVTNLPYFIASTEVNPYAGSRSDWDELVWVFRIHPNDKLNIFVYSGSFYKEVLISEFLYPTENLLNVEVDKDNHAELILPLPDLRNGNRSVGKIKLKYILEVGDEWDWFMIEYLKNEKEKQKLLKYRNKLNVNSDSNELIIYNQIVFPIQIEIISISAYDLISTDMGLNIKSLLSMPMSQQQSVDYLHVNVECGSWNYTTEEVKLEGLEGAWKNLNWSIGMISERANLIFEVYSKNSKLGRYSFTGKEIYHLPKLKGNNYQTIGNLHKNGEYSGHISVHFKLLGDSRNIDDPSIISNSTILKNMLSTNYDNNMDISTNLSTNITDELKTELSDGMRKPFTIISTIDTTSIINNQDVILPAILTIKFVTINNIPQCKVFAKNSPYVKIKSFNWIYTTKVMYDEDSKSITWKDLPNATFVLFNRMFVTFEVWSENILISSLSIPSIDLIKRPIAELPSMASFYHQSSSKVREPTLAIEIKDYLYDNSSICGDISTVLIVNYQGNVDEVISFLKEKQPDNKNISNLSPSSSLLTSMTPIAENFPFQMNIYSILLTDLRSVYYLKKNSPHINCACGNWASKSHALPNSGNSAFFHGFSWSFIVHESTNVHITVWCGEKVLGTGFIECHSILSKPVDNKGLSEIYIYLYSGNKPAGKAKIIFNIEQLPDNYFIKEAKPQTLPNIDIFKNPIRIELPMVVHIYSIILRDLKPVHLFNYNRPFVKAKCNNWFENTLPFDTIGNISKWDNLEWSVIMIENSILQLIILSDSTIIGYISFSPESLIDLPTDRLGITEVEGNIISYDGDIYDFNENYDNLKTGKILIICRLERYYSEESYDIDSNGDDNIMTIESTHLNKEDDTLDSPSFVDGSTSFLSIDESMLSTVSSYSGPLKLNDVLSDEYIKHDNWNIKISNIFVRDLPGYMHSPYVRLEYRDFFKETKSVYLANGNAQWDNLTWDFNMKSNSLCRITVVSGNAIVGSTSISTQEFFLSMKSAVLVDDLNSDKIFTYQKLIKYAGENTGVVILHMTMNSLDKIKVIAKDLVENEDLIIYTKRSQQIEASDIPSKPIVSELQLKPILRRPSTSKKSMKPTISIYDTKETKRIYDLIDNIYENISNSNTSNIVNNALQIEESQNFSIINSKIDFSNSRKLIIKMLKVWNLKSIHKNCKNSPKVTMESDRWKKYSKSIPFGGDSGDWRNLDWSLPLVRMTPLKIVVTSSNVVIGSCRIDIQDFINLANQPYEKRLGKGVRCLDAIVEKEVGKPNGNIQFTCFFDDIDENINVNSEEIQEDSTSIITNGTVNHSSITHSYGKQSYQFLSPGSFSSFVSSRSNESTFSNSTSYVHSETLRPIIVNTNDSSNQLTADSSSSSQYSNSFSSSFSDSPYGGSDSTYSFSDSSGYSLLNSPSLNTISNHDDSISLNKKSSELDDESIYSSSSYSYLQLNSTVSDSNERSDSISYQRTFSDFINSKHSESESNSKAENESFDVRLGSRLDYNSESSSILPNESIIQSSFSNQSNHSSNQSIGNNIKSQSNIDNNIQLGSSHFTAESNNESNNRNKFPERKRAINFTEMIAETATGYVNSLIAEVIKSFVAYESGGDYNTYHDNNDIISKTTDLKDYNSVIFEDNYINENRKNVIANPYTTPAIPLFNKQIIYPEFSVDLTKYIIKSALLKYIQLSKEKFSIDFNSSNSPIATTPSSSRLNTASSNRINTPSSVRRKQALMVNSKNKAINLSKKIKKSIDKKLTFKDIRSGFYRPNVLAITIIDITNMSLQVIHPSLLPSRPYITACKPYGNWASETSTILFKQREFKQSNDYIIEWLDLPNRNHWDNLILKNGQSIVFDLKDYHSGGLVIAKCTLEYHDLFRYPVNDNGIMTLEKLRFIITKEYRKVVLDPSTSIITSDECIYGTIKMSLDLSLDEFIRPNISESEFNQKKHIQHWRTYPLTPINTGIVRQKYPDISSDYDRQMIINPVFFGFKIRWNTITSNEIYFLHPTFYGYTLNKRPMTKQMKDELELQLLLLKKSNNNPFRHDPYEKVQKRCPVCRDGLDGCPRCFTPPTYYKGEKLTLQSFAFDPDKERSLIQRQEQRRIKLAAIALRKGKLLIDDDISIDELTVSTDSNTNTVLNSLDRYELEEQNENDRPKLHTKLTTYEAIRLYRNQVVDLITVYIKVIPGGYIRKLLCDPMKDSVFHLYHMFHSYSHYGSVAKSPMIFLPTSNGLYEMTNTMMLGGEMSLPDFSGRITLNRYGLKNKKSRYVLLYVSNYVSTENYQNLSIVGNSSEETRKIYFSSPYITSSTTNISTILQAYFYKNIKYNIPMLPIHKVIKNIPDNLSIDAIQINLLTIITKEYIQQQKNINTMYIQLGIEYYRGDQAKIMNDKKVQNNLIIEHQKLIRSEERRIESQIKGLVNERKTKKDFNIDKENKLKDRLSKLLVKRELWRKNLYDDNSVKSSIISDNLSNIIEDDEEDNSDVNTIDKRNTSSKTNGSTSTYQTSKSRSNASIYSDLSSNSSYSDSSYSSFSGSSYSDRSYSDSSYTRSSGSNNSSGTNSSESFRSSISYTSDDSIVIDTQRSATETNYSTSSDESESVIFYSSDEDSEQDTITNSSYDTSSFSPSVNSLRNKTKINRLSTRNPTNIIINVNQQIKKQQFEKLQRDIDSKSDNSFNSRVTINSSIENISLPAYNEKNIPKLDKITYNPNKYISKINKQRNTEFNSPSSIIDDLSSIYSNDTRSIRSLHTNEASVLSNAMTMSKRNESFAESMEESMNESIESNSNNLNSIDSKYSMKSYYTQSNYSQSMKSLASINYSDVDSNTQRSDNSSFSNSSQSTANTYSTKSLYRH